ncbi:MAG: helix-turn-helix domain-containing protein, partial [Motilibacteraceae bacterium]
MDATPCALEVGVVAARLSLAEREEIALGRAADLSIRKIAAL